MNNIVLTLLLMTTYMGILSCLLPWTKINNKCFIFTYVDYDSKELIKGFD